ncbi:guanine nucleotide binding protein, alpha subunit, partial [Chytriomyces sp. MP71]
MGCASSTFSPEEEAQMMQSRTIDKRLQLELDQKRKEASINVLLLGPGESGKSTILKQMKIIYKVGFSHEELQFFRATLIENVFQCVQTVVDAMERLQIPYD